MSESLFGEEVMDDLKEVHRSPVDEILDRMADEYAAQVASERDEEVEILEREGMAVLDEASLPTGKDLVINIDWVQTNKVLEELFGAYDSQAFPYNQDSVRVPQDHRHLPQTLELGSQDHAMFLWAVCYYMRGGMKSVDAVKLLADVYDDHPHLFNSEQASSLNQEELSELLRNYRLGYRYTQIASFWVENAVRMQERWDGDPRAMFEGVSDYQTCVERIKNDSKGDGFLGFQEKMVSMITYFLMDESMIEPFVFPLPVDLHVLRVSIENEMVVFENIGKDGNLLTQETLRVLRELYYRYALDNGIDPLRLCDAVWLLSNSLCGIQPGNVTLEPLGRKRRRGRKTMLVPNPIDLNSLKQRRDYERSCACCPLNSTCKWNVPSKYYYVQGILMKKGRRPEYPHFNESLLQ